MANSNLYKRMLLGRLLGFCYPEDGRIYFEAGLIPFPAFADPNSLARYELREELQEAVLDVLRGKLREKLPQQVSIDIIERAYNEHVKVGVQLHGSIKDEKHYSLERYLGIGRIVTEALFNALSQDGPAYYSVCERCEKIFLVTKSKQRFCSDQCRWDFWNDRRMEGYYTAAKKRSRENKRRIQKLKGGKKK